MSPPPPQTGITTPLLSAPSRGVNNKALTHVSYSLNVLGEYSLEVFNISFQFLVRSVYIDFKHCPFL